MRSKFATLVGVLCLLAPAALGEITRVSPSSFTPSGEDYLSIEGSDLLGTVSTTIVFDGQFVVAEPNFASPTKIISWIPSIVLITEGTHSVVVRSFDGAGVREHGPAFFTVSGPPADGPPLLFVPEGSVIAEAESAGGAVVLFDVSAISASGAILPVTCSHQSGATFPLGVTTVVCSASDAGGTAEGRFSVLVTDTIAPSVTVPADIETELSVVTFTASAVDAIDGPVPVACTPPSGSSFPVGFTRVTCRATDGFGNVGTGSFLVHSTNGPPLLILPPDIVEEAAGPNGAVVTYEAASEGGGTLSCAPASGATYALGTTVVTCVANNPNGTATGSFNVTVEDTTGPHLTLPTSLEVQATSASGAVVSWTSTAVDAVDGIRLVTCTPGSGTQFALGTTPVLCFASDTRGNVGDGTFEVTVVEDNTPPVLTLPSGMRVEATSPNGAAVPYSASALDAVDGVVPVQCAPASGSVFPIATSVVVCTASDTRGNTATGSFTVTVEDTTPPEIVASSVTPGSLWPPNHQMVDVVVTIVAVDAGDAAPSSRIVDVSSNQPLNGTGDGDVAPDWEITGALTLKLRAERAGSVDRSYRIVVECTDASGNASSVVLFVHVAGSKTRSVR
jgi:hypothetical protein